MAFFFGIDFSNSLNSCKKKTGKNSCPTHESKNARVKRESVEVGRMQMSSL